MSRHHRLAGMTQDVVVRFRTIWRQRMKEAEARGQPYVCPKCDKAVVHTDKWDVGHKENVSENLGKALDITNTTPEHSSCNRADGARITNAIKRSNRGRIRKWV